MLGRSSGRVEALIVSAPVHDRGPRRYFLFSHIPRGSGRTRTDADVRRPSGAARGPAEKGLIPDRGQGRLRGAGEALQKGSRGPEAEISRHGGWRLSGQPAAPGG